MPQGSALLDRWLSLGFMDRGAYQKALDRFRSHRCAYRAWGEATGYPSNVTIFDLYGT